MEHSFALPKAAHYLVRWGGNPAEGSSSTGETQLFISREHCGFVLGESASQYKDSDGSRLGNY